MDYCIPSIKLVSGPGSPENGGCWMSALSVYEGSVWSDHPECVDIPTREICIRINDLLSSDEVRGKVIGPRLFDPIGTAGDPDATRKRLEILVDASINLFAADAASAAANAAANAAASYASAAAAASAVTAASAATTYAFAAFAAAAATAASAATTYADAAAAAADAAAAASASAAYSFAAAAVAANDARFDSASFDAARDNYVIEKIMPVIDQMLDVGNKCKVEPSYKDVLMKRALQLA